MAMYDYETLREKAISPNATKEDRIALLNWFDQFDSVDFNGEYYDLRTPSEAINGVSECGLRLYPVYDMSDEDAVQFDVIDAEIR